MRAYVREHNVYRWAGNLIGELTSLRLDGERQNRPAPAPAPPEFAPLAATR
jgi:hypothetical protein